MIYTGINATWFAVGECRELPCRVTVVLGVLLALGLGWRRGRRRGLPVGRLALSTALLPLAGAFFAHLFYCLLRWEYVLPERSPLFLLAFWEQGHMLYGGMAGCLLALWLCGGGAFAARLADAYAPSGALMIAAARIAEGFSGQGYGVYCFEQPAFCQFPFLMYDAYYDAWAWALFLPEALVALGLLVLLLRKREGRPGDGALLLIGLYASAQIVLESLRRDDYLRWGFVRCAQVISAVAVLAVLLCYCLRARKGGGLAKTLCWAVSGALLALCLLLEFALEGRVPFLAFLNADGCYLCMAAACLALMACVLAMRGLGGEAALLHFQAKEGCP